MLIQLRDLGLPMRTARISALRQLVLQVPAPVIAGALGFHHTTTTPPVHLRRRNLKPVRRRRPHPARVRQLAWSVRGHRWFLPVTAITIGEDDIRKHIDERNASAEGCSPRRRAPTILRRAPPTGSRCIDQPQRQRPRSMSVNLKPS